MKPKRQTKAQKEAIEKAKLLQRVTDVYSGAMGAEWSEDEWATAEILANAIHALKGVFGKQVEWGHMWECHCIGYYDTPAKATEFLFGVGIRA